MTTSKENIKGNSNTKNENLYNATRLGSYNRMNFEVRLKPDLRMALDQTPSGLYRLWIIFILFGLGPLSLNWTTDQIGFSLLSFLLFSGSAMASSIYSPWIISVSLPVGAVLFWIFRNKLRLQLPPPDPAVPITGQQPTLDS